MRTHSPAIGRRHTTWSNTSVAGCVRARPDAIHALEGSAPALAICIEFPDVDTARRWYDSPEYGAARLLREGASDAQLLLIDEQ